MTDDEDWTRREAVAAILAFFAAPHLPPGWKYEDPIYVMEQGELLHAWVGTGDSAPYVWGIHTADWHVPVAGGEAGTALGAMEQAKIWMEADDAAE